MRIPLKGDLSILCKTVCLEKRYFIFLLYYQAPNVRAIHMHCAEFFFFLVFLCKFFDFVMKSFMDGLFLLHFHFKDFKKIFKQKHIMKPFIDGRSYFTHPNANQNR